MALPDDEQLKKDYIDSLMFAVPEPALMVPPTRPIKTCVCLLSLFSFRSAHPSFFSAHARRRGLGPLPAARRGAPLPPSL
jgi:hypothetical protein